MIAEPETTEPGLRSTANPFPGLRPFEYHENYLFFGRVGQSEEMALRLGKTHFLAVVGTSGTGKSSLVRAGLWPALLGDSMEDAGSVWRIVVMRPGNNPIGNLALALNYPVDLNLQAVEPERIQTIQAMQTEVTLRRSDLGLIDAVSEAQLAEDENLLIVVDQFEELFRFEQFAKDEVFANDGAAFVKLLLEARQPRVYVVLTMRSDYLGDCAKFLDLPEVINESQYLIPRMTRDQRREAMIGPVGVRGASISPSLVNQLMIDMGEKPDQLPLLQHALMRIWGKWLEDGDTNGPLDVQHYQRCGGVETLSRHADEAYDELRDDRSKLAERVFKCLTEKGTSNRETRRPTEFGEICSIVEASETEMTEVIDVFRREGRCFLMPTEKVRLEASTGIDISHESLISGWHRLKEWVEEEADAGREYRRLAEDGVVYPTGELLERGRLQAAVEWRERNKPNLAWASRHHARYHRLPKFSKLPKQDFDKKIYNETIAFLDKNKRARDKEDREREAQRRKEVRRAWRFAATGAAVAVVIFVVLLFALQTLRQRDKAIAQTLRMNQFMYRTTMNLAQQAFRNGKWGETNQFLNQLPLPGVDDLRGLDWYYVWRASHDERETLRGLSTGVSSVDLSPDGQTVATGSEDGTVRLWNLNRKEKPIAELKGHQAAVLSVAFAPNGKMLVSGGADTMVRLWDLETGQQKDSKRPGDDASAFVRSVAFSRDSNSVAIGTFDGSVWIWKIGNSQPIKLPIRYSSYVSSVAFCPDNTTIVSGSADGTAKLCDTANWAITDLTADDSKLLSPEGRPILSVAVSPNGNTIAAGTQKGLIRLWDKGKLPAKEPIFLTPRTSAAALSLAFADNDTLISGNDDATLKRWDLRTRMELQTLKGHSDRINSIAVSSDGKMAVSASNDKTVKLWDLGLSTESIKLQVSNEVNGNGRPLPVAVSRTSGSTSVASGNADGTVTLWDLDKNEKPETIRVDVSPVRAVAFSPDGQLLAAGNARTVKVFNVASKKLVSPSEAEESGATCIVFAPNGKTIATSGDDGTVRLRDAFARTVDTLRDRTTNTSSLSFSSDGALLAAGGDDRIQIWNIGTRRMQSIPKRHSGPVLSLAFSYDAKLLASGSADNTAIIWDVETGNLLTTLVGHADAVVSVWFSPKDEKLRLVTASADGTVKFWDTNTDSEDQTTRKELATLTSKFGADRSPIGIWSIAFSPDGQNLVSLRRDGSVETWQTASTELVRAQSERSPK